jgi:thioredoxin reductase (NADPH)
MERMRGQAEHVGVEIRADTIVSLDLSRRPFVALADSGDEYLAETLVLATGAKARWLGLPSEAEFNGYGVSACATCDGFFYRNKEVVVVGGGNTAVEEALYLANICSKVTVVHRRDRFRAEPVMQDRLFAHPKVEVVWNHAVDEVLGVRSPAPGVTGVRLRDTATGATREVPCEGVFVAIGHDPATALVKGQLDMDEAGYVRVGSWSTATSVPGVWAAGDVCDPVFRQAITSASMGCMAALEAEKFLAAHAPDPAVRAEEARTPEMIGAYD